MILDVGPSRHRSAADVIVVGSGAAGLSAALALGQAGADVALVTDGALGTGATAWAQGGLAAAIDPADSPGAHAQDTIVAGAGLCEDDAVAQLTAAAPDAIRALQELGVEFDRRPDGSLALGLEGGHRIRRIVHAGGDASGAAVAAALADAVSHEPAVRVHAWMTAVDALTDVEGAICGLTALDADGAVVSMAAGAVVLATGGIGRAWPVTSNPPSATGAGLALALRAGAIVRDVEFVQFHPTVVVAPGATVSGTALVSEAVRGEGARLIDVAGRSVTAGVHPLGDLAPRDVVAAAIHRRMIDTGCDHVLLDATGFGARVWRERFPTILALCRARGIDPVTQAIPVAPAAHYSCGGVLADLDGRTCVPGLSAIGEVASTGVQGANRLASNGVTEAFVAGRRAASRIAEEISAAPRAARRGRPSRTLLHPSLRESIITVTGAGSGVLRTGAGLAGQLDALSVMSSACPSASRAAVQTTNLHTISTLVATAALSRTESRGSHRRADHPAPSPDRQEHQLLSLRDGAIHPTQPMLPVAA